MSRDFSRNQYTVIFVTILCYIWLCAGLPWHIALTTGYDERLQIKAAYAILSHEWLGDYYRLAMAKGAGFPLLMALLFYLGIPLLISMPLLYAAASFFFIHALRPAVRRRWPLIFAFIVLLFNPMQYHPTVLKIYRDGWTNCILLFVLAGVIALLCRRHSRIRGQVGWAVLLGFSVGLFWLMREEAVWITPALALVLLPMALISLFRERRFFIQRMLVIAGIPLCISIFMVQIICYLNWHHYGLWASVDSTSKNYTMALSLLVRAKAEHWQRYIVCPPDVRKKLYTVSPTFAELRSYLESDSFHKRWIKPELGLNEYGPYFMWALRDAVNAAGYYANAAKADAYYARLVQELEAAYAEGRIAKEPGLVFGGLTQPVNRRHLPTLLVTLGQGLNRLLLNNWLLHFSNLPSSVPSVELFSELWLAMRDIGNINIPSADPYLPKVSIKLRGWCFSPGRGQCDFALDTREHSCELAVSREEREDVRKHLVQPQSVDDPATARLGFVININGKAACVNAPLLVSSGGHEALLDVTTGKILEANRRILMRVDEFQATGVKTSSLRNNLDNFRRTMLEQIAAIYQYATKWLALISVALLAGYLVWALYRKKFPHWPLPYISATLFTLCVLRVATLTLLQAVFHPTYLRLMYMSPAWVGMYGGIAVCFVWLCERSWRDNVRETLATVSGCAETLRTS